MELGVNWGPQFIGTYSKIVKIRKDFVNTEKMGNTYKKCWFFNKRRESSSINASSASIVIFYGGSDH